MLTRKHKKDRCSFNKCKITRLYKAPYLGALVRPFYRRVLARGRKSVHTGNISTPEGRTNGPQK